MKTTRIQRRRTKGFKLPKDAICITRPGKWGNRFKDARSSKLVRWYREWLLNTPEGRAIIRDAVVELKGKQLACWCKIGEPCHGDVLVEAAEGRLK